MRVFGFILLLLGMLCTVFGISLHYNALADSINQCKLQTKELTENVRDLRQEYQTLTDHIYGSITIEKVENGN